ncbi:hypothetical protein DL93DRAFT_2167912 [Clavulina sp. PMI_390]|nr:hypothetical protein DL93DRAFT_2167912 [Clavulina sp. PMI_390]
MSHHGRPLSSQVASHGNRAPSNDKLAAIEDPFDLIQAINQTPRISFSARFESQPQPLAERNHNAPPRPIIPPDFYYEKPFKRSKVTTKLPSTRGSLGWGPYKSDAERIRERRRMKNAPAGKIIPLPTNSAINQPSHANPTLRNVRPHNLTVATAISTAEDRTLMLAGTDQGQDQGK